MPGNGSSDTHLVAVARTRQRSLSEVATSRIYSLSLGSAVMELAAGPPAHWIVTMADGSEVDIWADAVTAEPGVWAQSPPDGQ